MREILFRGKKPITKDWVYGTGLLFDGINTWIVDNPSHKAIAFGEEQHIVITETIGQYTGLTDKNGTKFFEDDIVKVTDDNGETNSCGCGIGCVCFLDGSWYIEDEVNDGLYDTNRIYYIEIIGNIHDNPDLLKGGADNG